MNIGSMREVLSNVYTGASWKERVGCMSNEQVFAVYKRLERCGELYEHNRRTEHITPPIFNDQNSYVATDSEGRTVWIMRGP